MTDLSIEVQLTPNPNAVKFTLNRAVTEGSPKTFTSLAEAASEPMAAGLLGVPGIVRVFMTANFISITKTDEADWTDIVPLAKSAIEAGLS
jgi:hypothetical protein